MTSGMVMSVVDNKQQDNVTETNLPDNDSTTTTGTARWATIVRYAW
ncbi:MAG: hypothetical protein ACR5LD_09530 [Symbiopectobacterium sp.]